MARKSKKKQTSGGMKGAGTNPAKKKDSSQSKSKVPKGQRFIGSTVQMPSVKESTPKKSRAAGLGPKGMHVIDGTVTGSKGDPLDFQISAKVKVPKGRTLSARVLTEAIRYRIEKGRSPKGIQLKIIRWRNPNRKETNPDWRYPDDDDVKANVVTMLGTSWAASHSPQQAAWVTLRQALEAVQVSDISMG